MGRNGEQSKHPQLGPVSGIVAVGLEDRHRMALQSRLKGGNARPRLAPMLACYLSICGTGGASSQLLAADRDCEYTLRTRVRHLSSKNVLNRRLLLQRLAAGAAMVVSSAGMAEPLPSDPIRGEVVKIDQERGTVELKHEAIPYLHLPAKRTVFRYYHPNVVLRAKDGDRVIFRANRYDGALVVTGPMIPLPK